jgi:hypothetical protein
VPAWWAGGGGLFSGGSKVAKTSDTTTPVRSQRSFTGLNNITVIKDNKDNYNNGISECVYHPPLEKNMENDVSSSDSQNPRTAFSYKPN